MLLSELESRRHKESESFEKIRSREWGEIKWQAGRGTGEEFATTTKGRGGLKHLLKLFSVTYELR